MPGFSSVSIFARTTLPSRGFAPPSRAPGRAACTARTTAPRSPRRPGPRWNARSTSASNSASLTSMTVMARRVVTPRRALAQRCGLARSIERSIAAPGVTIGVSDDGDGIPVVLLHGLDQHRAATSSWGPTALQRAGHRVDRYDARGHGLPRPRRRPTAYGYDELSADLVAVLDALELERAVLAGGLDGRAHDPAPRARRCPSASRASSSSRPPTTPSASRREASAAPLRRAVGRHARRRRRGLPRRLRRRAAAGRLA